LKLLMIRSGALGDTLLMLPALAGLREKATIHFAGRQPGLGHISHAVFSAMDLERAGWHRIFSDHPSFPGSSPLPVSGADRVVAFFKDTNGVIKQNLKGFFPNAPVWVFPAFPPKTQKIHVARYLAECLESAGLPVNPDAVMDAARKQPLISGPRVSNQRDRLVFHPGSGDPKKNHSPDFWQHILERCKAIIRLAHLKPTLLLGPAEISLKAFFEGCEDAIKGMEILFCPEREQLLRVLGSAALYLGHDSGITHLSGLMGTPTVALFKGTDPAQWGPLGMHVRIVHRQKADRKLLEITMDVIHEMASVTG